MEAAVAPEPTPLAKKPVSVLLIRIATFVLTLPISFPIWV